MIVEKFLDIVELSDPGLYDALDGDGARRELANTSKPYYTLIKHNGKDQKVIGRKSIIDKRRTRRAITLLIVQDRS
jgi:hypothetical protein